MNEFLIEKNVYNGGIQKVFKFPNGYGASVVRHKGSYGYMKGQWEIAVLDESGAICYSTPITDNVIGYLNDPEVDNLLGQISRL